MLNIVNMLTLFNYLYFKMEMFKLGNWLQRMVASNYPMFLALQDRVSKMIVGEKPNMVLETVS